MDIKTFYKQTAGRNESYDYGLLPQKPSFAGAWGQKSRIQITYEMLAGYKPFNNLLDLGCGNLANLITLESLFTKGFGVDITSYPSWDLLKNKFDTFENNLDSGLLLFESSTFDAVTILMVLEHVFDPFVVVEEMSRVTKPGGLLVINVPNIAYIKHRLGLLFGQIPTTSNVNCWEMREWDGGHIHYFTLERLAWLLQTFGKYEILKVTSSGRLEPLKRLYPSLLCSDLQVLCRKQF